jgi:hypothetical protein
MQTCICGRTFKNKRALASHMGTAPIHKMKGGDKVGGKAIDFKKKTVKMGTTDKSLIRSAKELKKSETLIGSAMR